MPCLFFKEIKRMKRQLRVTLLEKKMKMISPKWLLVVVIALLCFGVAIPSAAQADSAQLRLGHFVFDGPAFNLYVNGDAIVGEDDAASLFYPMTLSERYLDFPAGAHTFALAAEGDTLDSAVIGEQELTLEAEHRYLLAVMGNVAADDLHFTLIDETAALEAMDISVSAVSIIINNLSGIPAMDGFFASEVFFSDLAYGDYAVTQDPTEGSGTLIIADDDPETVIAEFPEAVGSPPNVFGVFVFSGAFSGAQWDGYSALYVGQYVGELSISDGGAIAVGEALPVELTDMGQRVQFTLTLDAAATLDIVQSGEAELDAYLRLYNLAGDIIYENDELSLDDNAEGIYDAGWNGLELEAGTYIIEAATVVDTGSGAFTLSVSAPG
jgi:hypothetical protein